MFDFLQFFWSASHDALTALVHGNFHRPMFFFLLIPLLLCVPLWGKRQFSIRHSTLAPHKSVRTWSMLVVFGYFCLTAAVTNIDLAIMGPTVPEASVERIAQVRNVCNANDRSGSMTTVLEDGVKDLSDDEAKASNDPTAVKVDNRGSGKTLIQGPDKDKPPHPLTRVEGAQLAARYLIRHRMNNDPMNTDRYCLFTFDDDFYMMAPLTTDKRALTLRTAHIVENVGGGTNFINMLQKAYDYFMLYTSPASVRVYILDTDGYDSIDIDKRRELIKLYKEAHIKLYVIGLGEGWKEGNTLDLQLFANELHAADPQSGFVFRASNPGQMKVAMEQIDQIEKGREVLTSTVHNRDVDYAFVFGALAFTLLFFASANLARRVP